MTTKHTISKAIAIALAINWLFLRDKTDTLLSSPDNLHLLGKYGTWAIVLWVLSVGYILRLLWRLWRL